jgi:hypothetical protein
VREIVAKYEGGEGLSDDGVSKRRAVFGSARKNDAYGLRT